MNIVSNRILSELIDKIYSSAMVGDWHEALAQIRRLTHSNKIFFVISKLSEGAPLPLVTEIDAGFDYDPNLLVSYAESMAEDPWYQIAQSALEGDVLHYSKMKPAPLIEHENIYQQIFLPMRSYHCMGAVLLRNEKYEATFAINRGKEDEPYNDDDTEFIELITPHLSRAIILYIELQAYKNIANISQAISRNAAKALILCDEQANILELNDVGKNLLVNSDYFDTQAKHLRLTRDYLDAQVHKVIKDSALFVQRDIKSRQMLLLDDLEEKLVVEAVPLMDKYIHDGESFDCCLVIITPETTVDWQQASIQYSLTSKELEVAKRIYGKRRVSEIANELSMKENTVRTHVQNIYVKLGVRTQTEFMLALQIFSS